MHRALVATSCVLAIAACLYMLRAIWRRDRDSWEIGTGAGLMLINAWGAGLAAAANAALVALILLLQVGASVLLLRRREAALLRE